MPLRLRYIFKSISISGINRIDIYANIQHIKHVPYHYLSNSNNLKIKKEQPNT